MSNKKSRPSTAKHKYIQNCKIKILLGCVLLQADLRVFCWHFTAVLICSPFFWQSPLSGWCASVCMFWRHDRLEFHSETHMWHSITSVAFYWPNMNCFFLLLFFLPRTYFDFDLKSLSDLTLAQYSYIFLEDKHLRKLQVYRANVEEIRTDTGVPPHQQTSSWLQVISLKTPKWHI